MKKKLSQEQSSFAAEHHDVVIKFLADRNFPEEDYYDSVIFGYLDAVREFFSQNDLIFEDFLILAQQNMDKQIALELEIVNQEIPSSVWDSDDYGYCVQLEELVVDQLDTAETAIASIQIEKTMCCLEQKEQEIFRLLMEGKTLQTTAKHMRIPCTELMNVIHLIRSKVCL